MVSLPAKSRRREQYPRSAHRARGWLRCDCVRTDQVPEFRFAVFHRTGNHLLVVDWPELARWHHLAKHATSSDFERPEEHGWPHVDASSEDLAVIAASGARCCCAFGGRLLRASYSRSDLRALGHAGPQFKLVERSRPCRMDHTVDDGVKHSTQWLTSLRSLLLRGPRADAQSRDISPRRIFVIAR